MQLGATKYNHICPLSGMKAKVWVSDIEHKLGVRTAYGIEKHFSPNTIKTQKDVGTRHSCKFDKHKRGEHVPSPKLVDDIEIEISGTKKWVVHSFWEIAKFPMIDPGDLYTALSNLRPDISNLLFFSAPKNGRHIYRLQEPYFDSLTKLDIKSDFDALAACIGLLHEAVHFGHKYKYFRITQMILRIFLRVILRFPLRTIAEELFNYLKEYFLHIPQDAIWSNYIDSIDLHDYFFSNEFIIDLFEELQIFKHYVIPPLTCLYLSEKYLTQSVLQTLWKYKIEGDWKKIKQHPEIKKLIRRARYWETKNMPNVNT